MHRSPALVFALLVSPALAQPAGGGEGGSSWGIGLGAASTQQPYAGIDRENKAIPILQYENKYVRLFGPGVEVKLPGLRFSDTQRLDFALIGRFDFSAGYEESDARIFEGMAERKGGFLAGAKVEWKTSAANISFRWFADASGYSKGQVASVAVGRDWRFGRHWMLSPRAGVTWQDRKHVDYYFGVRDGEARVGRPAYRPDAAVSAEVGLRGAYLFDRNHSVFIDAGVTSLPKEIKDSPLVDRSSRNNVFMGYVYRFR